MDTSVTLSTIYSQMEVLNASGAFSSQGFGYLQGINSLELLSARDTTLIDAFEEWNLTNDTKKLEKDLRMLIRAHYKAKGGAPPIIAVRMAPEPNKEAASPLGDFLQVQKKHQRGEMQLTIALQHPGESQTEEKPQDQA